MKKIALNLLAIVAVANAGVVKSTPVVSEAMPVISDNTNLDKNYWYSGEIGAVSMMKGDTFGQLEGLTVGTLTLNAGGVTKITEKDSVRVEAQVFGAKKLLDTDTYKATEVSNVRFQGNIEISHKTNKGRGYISVGDIDADNTKLIGNVGVGNYFFAPLNLIGVTAGYENAKGCDMQLSYIYKTAPQRFTMWHKYTEVKSMINAKNNPIYFQTHYKGNDKYSIGFEDLYIKDHVNIAYLEGTYKFDNFILSGQYAREDNNNKFSKQYKLKSHVLGIKASMSKDKWFGYIAYNHIGDNPFNGYTGVLGGNPLFTSSKVLRGEVGGQNTNAGRALLGYDFGDREIALSIFHSKGDVKEINGIELAGKRKAFNDKLVVESHIGYFKSKKDNKKDLIVNASISYNF